MASLTLKLPNKFDNLFVSEYNKRYFNVENYHCGILTQPLNHLAGGTAVKSLIKKLPIKGMIRITMCTVVFHHVHVTSPTYVARENNAPECFLHTLLHSLSIHRGSIITIQVPGCNTPI